MADRYDVVVVGGGSAGCAAAMRLSEDAGRRVLLIEAGPDPQPIPELVADPALQPRLLLEAPFVEMLPTPRALDESVFYSIVGRVMGGGSSVNVTAIPRPMRYDLDGWAALGNPDWSYDRLLPIMKRIETDLDFPDSPIHGHDGPLTVYRPFGFDRPMSDLARAFIDRARAVGLPQCDDVNGPAPEGVAAWPQSLKEGRRQSTAVAYLARARGRPNLEVVAEAPALSLELRGRRVERVRYERDGQVHEAAGDHIVLSAGAYHTPQLMMLSGIGPVAPLEALGIKVAHRLDGVGENYQDHAVVFLTYEGPPEIKGEWIVPRYLLIVKSEPSRPVPDFHIIPRLPVAIEGLRSTISISAHLLEQRIRGRVTLASTDPRDLPLIDPHMLEHPDDVQAMVATMRFIDDLVQHESLRAFYGPRLQPGPNDDWARFARGTHDSYHHGAGTCMMGPASNSMAVVDQTLRVHGLDNLWVADASIMPTVVHANTNLTCIMTGEVVADRIKAAS